MWSKIVQGFSQAVPRRVVDVGWAITEGKSSLIWDDPVVYRRNLDRPASSKSVQVCPAAIDLDARHFVVKCPIDINLKFAFDEQNRPVLRDQERGQGTVRTKHLGNMVAIINRAEWRHPDRPIIQIPTPYLCLADEPVWINQLPAYLDYADPPLPGALIAGRFPIHIWPRHLMWAFEWFDTAKALVISRGAPWFYMRFETQDPARPVRLVEAEITPEVQSYIDSIYGVTNYVNRTFSLFDRAQKRRPKQLLFPRRRGS